MKNWQQSVKQRRVNLEKAKRELRHSNPHRVFHQEYVAKYRRTSSGKWEYGTTKNHINYRGHKL